MSKITDRPLIQANPHFKYDIGAKVMGIHHTVDGGEVLVAGQVRERRVSMLSSLGNVYSVELLPELVAVADNKALRAVTTWDLSEKEAIPFRGVVWPMILGWHRQRAKLLYDAMGLRALMIATLESARPDSDESK